MKLHLTQTIKSVGVKTLLVTLVMLVCGAFQAMANYKSSDITFNIYIDDPKDAVFNVRYPAKWGIEIQLTDIELKEGNFTKVESGEYAGYYLASVTLDNIWYSTGINQHRTKLVYYPGGCKITESIIGKTKSYSVTESNMTDVYSIEGFGSYPFYMNNMDYYFYEKVWYGKKHTSKKVSETSTRPLNTNQMEYMFNKVLNDQHGKVMTYVINTKKKENITTKVPVYNMQEDETVEINGTTYNLEDIPANGISVTVPSTNPKVNITTNPAEGRTAAVYVNGVLVQPTSGNNYELTLKAGDKVEVKFDAEFDLYLSNMKDGDSVVVNGTTYDKDDEVDGGVHITVPADEQPIVIKPSDSDSRGGRVYVNNEPQEPDENGEVIIDNLKPGDKVYVVFEDKEKQKDPETGKDIYVYPDEEEVAISVDALHKTMSYTSHEDLYFPNQEGEKVMAFKILKDASGNLNMERLYGRVKAGEGIFLKFDAEETVNKVAAKRANASHEVVIYTLQRAKDQTDYADVDFNLLKPLYQHEMLNVSDPVPALETEPYDIYMFYDEVLESWVNNNNPEEQHSASDHNEAYVMLTTTGGDIPFIPTAIENITIDGNDTQVVEGIFSLSGYRFPANTDVNSLAPGFYIVNGKKLLVK